MRSRPGIGWLSVSFLLLSFQGSLQASSGTDGAAFLDIPVGAGPAALGGAYTALAEDAYAATWNPAGLGNLSSTQLSGQHLSYLDTLHYEYFSFALPFARPTSCSESSNCRGSALGGSIQYLGSGNVGSTDLDGNSIGSYSSYYSAYNLAYGRAINDALSLGATGKFIHAQLGDYSASAFALDLGGIYKLKQPVTLAATLTNLGSKLKFIEEGDSLPLALHLGAAYQPSSRWLTTSEVVVPKTGLASLHLGGQWRPLEMVSLRVGYRTDTLKGLSALAGFTTGLGMEVWGQELAYAWVPYGELGSTHYISLLMKFGEAERAKRNLIQFHSIKAHRTVNGSGQAGEDSSDVQLMELLKQTDDHVAQVHPRQGTQK